MIIIKICGIICEYNPLHKGHIYQIMQARKETEADFVVCIMSGNFVQRGENAIFDKFLRAEAAIRAGADAVVELPQIYALQSAEYFAYGGVSVAENIGCTHLCFGSECGSIDEIMQATDSEDFEEKINSGISYGNSLDVFKGEPNSMLGKEYVKTINECGFELIPVTVKRNVRFDSASKIREHLHEYKTHPEMFPIDETPLFFDKFFDLIKYKIIASDERQIRKICGVNEGLEYKLKKEVLASNNMNELILNVKSKRYTYSRISRILCNLLLDITKDKLKALINDTPKVKLLAVNQDKIQLLSLLDNYYISPLDAQNGSESTAISSETNVLSTKVYSIFSPLNGDEDYTTGLNKIDTKS